jgi:hypothetical protein
LDVEVRLGKEHAGKYGMPDLWVLIDSLGREAWPQFIRGDSNYGNEENIKQAEACGLGYLFKQAAPDNESQIVDSFPGNSRSMEPGRIGVGSHRGNVAIEWLESQTSGGSGAAHQDCKRLGLE